MMFEMSEISKFNGKSCFYISNAPICEYLQKKTFAFKTFVGELFSIKVRLRQTEGKIITKSWSSIFKFVAQTETHSTFSTFNSTFYIFLIKEVSLPRIVAVKPTVIAVNNSKFKLQTIHFLDPVDYIVFLWFVSMKFLLEINSDLNCTIHMHSMYIGTWSIRSSFDIHSPRKGPNCTILWTTFSLFQHPRSEFL